MIVEKDIFQLQVGSYVVAITKQKGKFNIKKSGWVRDFKAIEKLIHEGVLRVEIDTKKHLDQQSVEINNQSKQQNISTKDNNDAEQKSKQAIDTKKTKAKVISFQDKFYKAKKIFDEAKNIQDKVLSDIQQGQHIDTKPVKAIINASIESIFENPDALSSVINLRIKDQYLLEHSISVSILITIFAKHIGFDKTLIQSLAIGAFLHDVGKVMIPDEILHKPAKLSAQEFEIIKTHVVHSRNICEKSEGLSSISQSIVAKHHEKLDGSGYPDSLSEDDLSQYDRMISICDIFDALSADRVYKSGMAQVRAFAILRNMAKNNQLDPSLVNHFINCLGIYPVGSLVRLTSNRLAIVDRRNENEPTKPIVKAFYSINSNVFTETKEIDLAKSLDIQIEQGVRADEFDLDMNKITEFLLTQG